MNSFKSIGEKELFGHETCPTREYNVGTLNSSRRRSPIIYTALQNNGVASSWPSTLEQ